jgi:hypothetical protein
MALLPALSKDEILLNPNTLKMKGDYKRMKEKVRLLVKKKRKGEAIQFFGWSGRGIIDGGEVSAGPMSRLAPAWDEVGKEMGVNMVRIGFTPAILAPERNVIASGSTEMMEELMENEQTSWAKSSHTSYAYMLNRCRELGWTPLITINPSYASTWLAMPPHTAQELADWEAFVYVLAQVLEKRWPGFVKYFELFNEPDGGYFDGEHLNSGGITPGIYRRIAFSAVKAIRRVIPDAQILGPGVAFRGEDWLHELGKSTFKGKVDHVSYHNVMGELGEDRSYAAKIRGIIDSWSDQPLRIFNSEWSYFPNQSIDGFETAFHLGQMLFEQAEAGLSGSLYLGPAQLQHYDGGLGVFWYDPSDPNKITQLTRSYYWLRFVARGVVGGDRYEVASDSDDVNALARHQDGQWTITLFNPGNTEIHVRLEVGRTLTKVKIYQLDESRREEFVELLEGNFSEFALHLPARSASQVIGQEY